MIEDDFTRPRTRDLEQLDDDDDDDEGEEEQFQGREEREFVRRLSVLFWGAHLAATFRKSTRATSRHSTHFTRPTRENAKPLRISFLPSSRAAPARPLSYALLIDVRLSSLICALLTSTAAPGEDEAPDPAEGLDPKVVEVYTKCVSSHTRTKKKPAHA